MNDVMLGFLFSVSEAWWEWLIDLSCWVTVWGICAFVCSHFLGRFHPTYASWCWRLMYLKIAISCIGFPSLGVPLKPATSVAFERASFDERFLGEKKQIRRKREVRVEPVLHKAVFSGGAERSGQKESFEKESEELWGWVGDFCTFWLFVLWCVLLLGLCWRLVNQWRWMAKIRQSAQSVENVRVQSLYAALCKTTGLRRRPELLVSKEIQGPALTGLFYPVILLPPQVIETYPLSKVKMILAHELVHYCRRDLWWSCFFSWVNWLFFFHPMIWCSRRAWRLSEEMCADVGAMEWSEQNASEYGQLLLDVAQNVERFGVASMGARRFLHRRMMVMQSVDKMSKRWFLSGLILLLGVVGIVPWHLEASEPSMNRNVIPEGWKLVGPFQKHYEVGLDRQTFYDGHSSVFLRRKRGEKEKKPVWRFLGLRQTFSAQDFRGKRVRLTGFLKTSHLKSNAFVTFKVHKKDKLLNFGLTQISVLRQGIYQNRVSSGIEDWKKHEIVMDVPSNATSLMVTAHSWGGMGTLWCDAFRLEVVGREISITNGFRREVRTEGRLLNPDFDPTLRDQLSAWRKSYSLLSDYTIGLGKKEAYSGNHYGWIRSNTASSTRSSSLQQEFSAKAYRGQRIRLSAYLKSETNSSMSLWSKTLDSVGKRVLEEQSSSLLTGDNTWKKVTVTLDVESNASFIRVGCRLHGKGHLGCDHFQVERIGRIVARSHDDVFSNMDLGDSKRAEYWNFRGNVGTSTFQRETRSGHFATSISSRSSSHPVRLFQRIRAKRYQGKRLLIQADLKHKGSLKTAKLYLSTSDSKGLLHFRSVQWKPSTSGTMVSLVDSISRRATLLTLGILYQGKGKLYIRRIRVKEVGSAQPLKGKVWNKSILYREPMNLDFSMGTQQTEQGIRPLRWVKWGSTPQDYRAGLSHHVFHRRAPSLFLERKNNGSSGFAQMLQSLSAEKYRGKRVRLSAYLKSKSADWFRLTMVTDVGRSSQRFDGPFSSTSPNAEGWYKVMMVRDIPKETQRIDFGCALKGKGPLWCDDFHLEVVGSDVPLTKTLREKTFEKDSRRSIRNLSFERE